MPAGIATLVRSTVLPGRSAGPESRRPYPRGTKPTALRSGLTEASMNVALSCARNVASDRAAPATSEVAELRPSGHRAVSVFET
jgi:hypothetical protein